MGKIRFYSECSDRSFTIKDSINSSLTLQCFCTYLLSYHGGKITWRDDLVRDSGISHVESRDSHESTPSAAVYDQKKESTKPPENPGRITPPPENPGRITLLPFELGDKTVDV